MGKHAYEITVVLWEDHQAVSRDSLPVDPDELISQPTLSVGLVMDETDKVIVLLHDLECYEDRDDATYTVILKDAIVARQAYGKIKLRPPRK